MQSLAWHGFPVGHPRLNAGIPPNQFCYLAPSKSTPQPSLFTNFLVLVFTAFLAPFSFFITFHPSFFITFHNPFSTILTPLFITFHIHFSLPFFSSTIFHFPSSAVSTTILIGMSDCINDSQQSWPSQKVLDCRVIMGG